MLNALTVDVEEAFHATEVGAPPDTWPSLASRVFRQTEEVLDLFARHDAKATFFILGWVAGQHPRLVRKILDAGHEIGCHSYLHRLAYSLTPSEFKDDTLRAVRAIEDAGGRTPRLYRAPSYSITASSLWCLDVLVECGFHYDSSIYPIEHDRYGIPGFGRAARMMDTPSGPICEVPIAAVNVLNCSLPVGGGGYLRLLPYTYTAAGLRRMNQVERQPACVYFHPWELDPEQPRLTSGVVSRLRTYTGLAGMTGKLDRLLSDFRFAPLTTVWPHNPPPAASY